MQVRSLHSYGTIGTHAILFRLPPAFLVAWTTLHAHTRRDDVLSHTGITPAGQSNAPWTLARAEWINDFDRNKGSCWCSYLMFILWSY